MTEFTTIIFAMDFFCRNH